MQYTLEKTFTKKEVQLIGRAARQCGVRRGDEGEWAYQMLLIMSKQILEKPRRRNRVRLKPRRLKAA